MPATLQRGYTFGATELVTNTKLHTLVDGGTVSGVDETNLASGKGLVVTSTSAPSSTSALWLDSSTSPATVRIYTGSEWQGAASYGVFTNKSGGSVVAGDVVIIDTANAGGFTTTTSANNQRVLGVVMHTIANNADGIIALAGARVENLNCNGTVTVGDFLATSTTAKQALPSSTFQTGTFAIAMAARTGAGTIAEAVLIGGNSGFTLSASNALTGSVVQTVSSQTGATSSGTTTIPRDDTIPQNTEGDEKITLAITPFSATNKLLIMGHVNFVNSSAGNEVALALFQDSVANALAVGAFQANDANEVYQVNVAHFMDAGTTSSTTFKLRIGGEAAGTTYVNGNSGGRLYGALYFSWLRIMEIKV